jgi:predicted DNA-binding transcriptional regulator AlpA
MKAKNPRPALRLAGDVNDQRQIDHIASPGFPASLERLITPADWLPLLSVSQATYERLRRAGRLPEPDLSLGRGLERWRPETVRRWIEGGGS